MTWRKGNENVLNQLKNRRGWFFEDIVSNRISTPRGGTTMKSGDKKVLWGKEFEVVKNGLSEEQVVGCRTSAIMGHK